MLSRHNSISNEIHKLNVSVYIKAVTVATNGAVSWSINEAF